VPALRLLSQQLVELRADQEDRRRDEDVRREHEQPAEAPDRSLEICDVGDPELGDSRGVDPQPVIVQTRARANRHAEGGGSATVSMSSLGFNERRATAPFSQSNYNHLYRNPEALHNGYRGATVGGAGALNASASWKVVLTPGTYSLDLIYVAYSDAGIMIWTLDAANLGNVDGYSPGAAFNTTASLPSFTVTTGGVKTLTVTMSTKNTASSGYDAYLEAIQLRRLS
jgi:hypothetical protein